ncbi:IS30 family transposase [Sulfurovum riftiae]|uniref:Integrase n=1 Tax=Sulfurovum riftiae TaxID=1630136 RepID=A0A151CGI1_9BACT|nr:IS30 family transposase [Sulfurovum riftiae]KYJ86638.1 integrase [Sulfurovum riftiae]
MKYKQLTLTERYHISLFLERGCTQKEIAEELGVHPSTISREIRRNWDTHSDKYEYTTAHINTEHRHKSKSKYTVIKPQIENYIREKLKAGWSPEQIAGRMKYERIGSISHETIYQFIYRNKASKGRLYKYLRHKNKKYHKRCNDYQRRGTISDRRMIDTRPKIVEKKKRIGDLEIDTVIGKDHIGALVTAVDRKSKFTLIKKVPSKHAELVTTALIEMLEPIKPVVKTITSDNGKEFAYHKQVSEILDTDFYFANPYHSWERGLNEHTNGLIRQYLPKKTDFTQVSKEDIITIQEKLNHRPRKVLNYRTPYEVFFEEFAKELAA